MRPVRESVRVSFGVPQARLTSTREGNEVRRVQSEVLQVGVSDKAFEIRSRRKELHLRAVHVRDT